VTGCKDNDFKVVAEIFENLSSVGPDINPRLDDFASWKFNREFDIIGNFS
jgi:hypothetical protein